MSSSDGTRHSRVVGTSDLSRGFCNSVHLVTTETSGGAKERLVVKLYSDLSTLRVPAGTRGKPDALAAANGLAPAVVNSTHAGARRRRPERFSASIVDTDSSINIIGTARYCGDN